MHGWGKPSRAGFTLVEVMLVMIITAILTGAVMTNLHAGYQDIALENEMALLGEFIDAAQNHARLKNEVTRLVIEPARGEYFLQRAVTVEGPFRPIRNLGETQKLDRGIKFYEIRKLRHSASAHEHIHFFADGTAEPARITLTAENGEKRIVVIQPLAGPAMVSSY